MLQACPAFGGRFVAIPPNICSVLQASSVLVLVLVFCVLLIACVNVASLLLAWAESAAERDLDPPGHQRPPRTADPSAADRELVLSALGGGIGILIAIWTSQVFPTLIPSFGMPIAFDTAPDATVLGFTLVLTPECNRWPSERSRP